jgi:hypothetical protein
VFLSEVREEGKQKSDCGTLIPRINVENDISSAVKFVLRILKPHWEDQDVGGWTILKWILDRMGWYGLD